MKPMSAMRSASSRTSTSTSVEREVAPLDEVDEAAGRADDDVDALAERVDLRLEADAAVDGLHAPAAAPRPSGASTSTTWLASSRVGHEHEPVRVARLGLADPLDEREPEGERLAGAGLGLAADVAPGEAVADRERLDGERVVDAVAREGVDEVGRNAERLEGRAHGEVLAFVVGSFTVEVPAPTGAVPARPKGRRGGGSILGAAPSSEERREGRAVRYYRTASGSLCSLFPG